LRDLPIIYPNLVLSNTLDVCFCLEALEQALRIAKPEIFNTDQGSQFTSSVFTGLLEQNDIRISMDGRGRAFDNIFIERLWRTVKYEEVYLNDYQDGVDAYFALDKYFRFYLAEIPLGTMKRDSIVHLIIRLPVKYIMLIGI